MSSDVRPTDDTDPTYSVVPSIHADTSNWCHFSTRAEASAAKAIRERKFGPQTVYVTGNPPVHDGTYK